MTIARPEIETLLAEVAALKQRVRFYGRAFAAGMAVCAGTAVLFAAGPLQSQQQKVTAQEITIVDASGKARGTWSGDAGIILNNSAISFRNAESVQRMLMNVADNEPTIYLLDAAGKTRTYIDVNAAGAARLSMSDDQGKQRLFVTVDPQKIPAIVLNDEAGKRRFLINIEKDEPTQGYFDADGKYRIYTNGGSFPRTIMYDGQGKQRNIVAVDQAGVPFISMNDAAEKRRVLLKSDEEGASLFFKDANGNDTTRLSGPSAPAPAANAPAAR